MTKRIVLLALFVFGTITAFNACKKDEEPDVDCSTITGATYNLKVQEIISENCLSCHATGASAAYSGIFDTYALAKSKGEAIYEQAVLEKNMPPDNPLPDSLANILHCWKEAGFPEN